ncbi:sensor histidine kinase [Enemella evansiae]|uniref:sensor histidine kinase n=1 Tax=Enemella evansiae TaxID=2016499 RepID=UPI000B97BBFE|nr:sensor domain-containing protein [Enemella evansiae]OYO05791.1 histidine kinase [Enemella evansiae]
MSTRPASSTVEDQPTESPEPLLVGHFRGVAAGSAYLLLSFPIALIAFVLVVSIALLGVGMSIVWAGLPILVLTVLIARVFAATERRMIASVDGRPAAEPAYMAPEGGMVGRLLTPLRDPQSWLDVTWVLVRFLLSIITFSVALTWLVGAAAIVLGPLSALVLDAVLPPGDYNPALRALGLADSIWADAALQGLVGLVFLLTLPWVIRGLATAQVALARGLLSSRAEHQREVGELRSSRAAVRQAETDQLRRLERDIHDGPQQRLVRLNMDLARARRMAATDPENAQIVLAGAMEQTQEALGELRMLSRGIAPPVLVDRGLAAAVGEAATRSLVPVQVEIDVPRLPAHVETAAYFVVSEALANLNKHSGASQARVLAGVEDDWLFVTVIDDGVGGADPAKGHGLAGLAERLRGVDGRLEVDSPVGGPSMVQAVIPCAS